MGKGRPVTDTDRERVRQLHAAGKGRNEIAAELGRPTGTITKIARSFDPPLTFDRTNTAAATQARQADLAARRVAFASVLQDVAEREVAKMTRPHLYFDWGGKEHDFDTYTASEPTPADKRALMLTAGAAIDRSLKLVPLQDDTGTDAAKSLVGQLAAGLTAAYEAMQPAPAEGDGDAP